MRKLLAILMVVGLCMGLTGPAMAAESTSSLTVTVSAIDLLSVDDGTAIALNGTAGSTALTGTDDTNAKLNYTHNSATSKKITAEVTTDPASDDITLTVAVTGGEAAQTICTAGTADAAKIVYTGIAAGAITDAAVTYHATATTASPAADYAFTITYTSADL